VIDLAKIRKERPDLAALMAAGALALVGRILELETELIAAKAERIANSKTSHAPPSTDPRPKPRSQRRKSERKTGGQPGHPGHRLEPAPQPDQIVLHDVQCCAACQHDLSGVAPARTARTQVFDLPAKIALVVTEHQMVSKDCPHCHAITSALAPDGAAQPTQYGPRLAGLAIYLHDGHFVPLERTADILEALTGHRVSEGWISSCQARLSTRLEPFISALTAALKASPVVCCDETGFRFAARRFWLHVCCTAMLTLLVCHRRRGAEGTRSLGVLPGYQGTAVHDHWPAYFMFKDGTHAVCNEHLARELDGVTEREGTPWAANMKAILLEAHEAKRQYHLRGLEIPLEVKASITSRYERCLKNGYRQAAAPPPTRSPTSRGRCKRGKTLSLLDRLRDHQDDTLRCLQDRHVPWSNNQAERDIRPMKTQQKITGGFRTEEGAIQFCRIRSYLSSATKNGVNPCEAIARALRGEPWCPSGRDAALVATAA
jgi:transposase